MVNVLELGIGEVIWGVMQNYNWFWNAIWQDVTSLGLGLPVICQVFKLQSLESNSIAHYATVSHPVKRGLH